MKSAEVATFALMNRLLGIAILVAFTTVVWGQSSGNPFDLKYRKPVPPAEKKVITPVSPDTSAKPVLTPPVSSLPEKPTTAPVDTIQLNKPDTSSGISFTNPFETDITQDTTIHDKSNESETKVLDTPVKKSPSKVVERTSSRGFPIFFLLLSLLFLIFIVNVERSFVRDLWRVISNENYSSLHHRNQRNTMRQILLIMGYLIFIFQAALFIDLALDVFNYTQTLLSSLWISLGMVLGVYLVRHGVIRYLRWLFNNDKELSLYGFDISIFNTMIGLMLLPINMMVLFGPESLYKPLIILGIVLIGAAYLMRQLRWLFTARHLIANSLFLFFVYLCAVEILPLWTISKIFW